MHGQHVLQPGAGGGGGARLFDRLRLKFGVIPRDSPLSACHPAAQTLRPEHPGPHSSQGSQVIYVATCVLSAESHGTPASRGSGVRSAGGPAWSGYLVFFPLGDQSVPDKTRLKTRSITELAYVCLSWAKNAAQGKVSPFCFLRSWAQL